MIQDEAEEYFIICEQRVICKVPLLKTAIFTVFPTYYSFNLNNAKEF